MLLRMVQRVRNIIGPFFHAFVCVHHVCVMIYSNKPKDLTNVTDQRVHDMENFTLMFFTTWNLLIQTMYFALAKMHDILHILSIKQDTRDKILLLKGYIFTSLVFPCSLFVTAMFWGVYIINREWVLPEALDEFIPNWLNHSIHTNILFFLVIELLITNQLLPTFKSAFIGLSVLSIVYHVLFLSVYFYCGRWLYGLFYIFTWPERIIFMISNYVFLVLIMKVGIYIQNFKHTRVRGKEIDSKDE